MFKINFYLKIIYQIFVLRSKFIFLFLSFLFFMFLKYFKKKDYQNYQNFFENFSETKNKNFLKNKNCIHVNFFSWFDIQNTFLSFFIINLIGSKRSKIVYFKTSFFKFIKNKFFIFDLPLNYYSKVSFFKLYNLSSEVMKMSYDEVFRYKYRGIQCGKYSISSSIRILKTPEINFKNKNHYFTVKYFLIKSILLADAAINYLDENKEIDCAIFNDKSYVGAGELFDQCIIKKIKCIQFVASYKNNILLLKKFDEKNQYDHPSSISQEIWDQFKINELSLNQKNYLNNEIKIQYQNNTWYPSAGTMIGKDFSNHEDLLKELNLDKSKKTSIIFPHIFWDGTFFFGKDLFSNYIEWYRETLKVAKENKNLNWIIKSHPSNLIKNNRDKISNNKEEPELTIIKELFGEIPKNFTFLGANSKINTFQLFEILDYCFTIRGTVGIEAALKNKVVITAGTGRYNDRGFTYNFDNKKEYFDLISDLHNFKHTKKDIIKNAEKFAYLAFICKTFELSSANFFYEKDNLASLKFEIKYDQLNNIKFNTLMNNINKWIEGKYSDYFTDPCNEWNLK